MRVTTRPPRFLPPGNSKDPMDCEDWTIKLWPHLDWNLTSTEEHIDGVWAKERSYRGLASIHTNPEASRLRRAKIFYKALEKTRRCAPFMFSSQEMEQSYWGTVASYSFAHERQLGL